MRLRRRWGVGADVREGVLGKIEGGLKVGGM